jgi:hypothetical protein
MASKGGDTLKYFKDITGEKFGRLTAVKRASTVKHGQQLSWVCICDCGNTCIAKGSNLRRGTTKSCGCLRRESVGERSRKIMLTHGGTKTRLYSIWVSMKNRCSCPNNTHFDCYGGRGIKICEEWKDFENFRDWAISNGYDDSLTLDRTNNDGNYEPANCRWVTRKDQANNRRTNRLIEFNGQSHNLKTWAEILGIHPRTLKSRLDAGWSIEKAFIQPTKGKL